MRRRAVEVELTQAEARAVVLAIFQGTNGDAQDREATFGDAATARAADRAADKINAARGRA